MRLTPHHFQCKRERFSESVGYRTSGSRPRVIQETYRNIRAYATARLQCKTVVDLRNSLDDGSVSVEINTALARSQKGPGLLI